MTNVFIAFPPYYDSTSELVDSQKIDCHWIFDIKHSENFWHKARIVAGGHPTKTPSSDTNSTVVSRDSVRICLTIVALNGMKVMTTDIQKAYLTAPCREKNLCKAAWEFKAFGIEYGTTLLIVWALYGQKMSGDAFRAFCLEQLDKMNFHSTTGDPDVWIRPCVDGNRDEFLEYLLVYVDDVMSISFDPEVSIYQLKNHGFALKGGKASVPESYVSAKMAHKQLAIHNFDC
jgi:Reverse transcriptase (RNA-dependent DNA polymerase)